MSKYTTGEIAKLCGVSVRTVQYYDSRKILIPSELSEGGRRLYSEQDLKRMKIICFLREAGISINSIGELLSDENPGNVISVLLDQQEEILTQEINERKANLEIIEGIRQELKSIENFSIESIGDIALIMENKNKIKKLRVMLLLVGIPITIFEWVSVILGFVMGIWWPVIAWLLVCIPIEIGIMIIYMKKVKYICPQCHEIFNPNLKEAFFAKHTPTLRKLTCTHCGCHGFCIEIYGGKNNE